MSKLLRGYLFVIASAFIFGCMPLMTKLIYAEGVNALSVVLLRNGLSLPVLALLAYRQSGSFLIPKKALPSIGAIALMGCCVTPYLLFSSYRYMASGTATVFHFVYPAVVLVGGILFLGEMCRRSDVLCVFLCIAGIGLFYDPTQPINLLGSILALTSGITYAIYILLLSTFKHKSISGYKLNFYVSAISCFILLVVCVCTNQLTLPVTARGWGLSLLLAITISVGAVFLFQQGTFLIGGERAGILSTVEPITGVFIGALAFQEHISLRTLTGSFLVILASFLIAFFDLRRSNKKCVS